MGMTWKDFIDFYKLPHNILGVLSIVSGALLLLPDKIIEKFYMIGFRDKYGFAIGIIFLISTDILIVLLGDKIYQYFHDKIILKKYEKRFTQECLGQQEDRKGIELMGGMSVLNYHGSKKRIAAWIIQHMPSHHSYLEPYFGGGAVLFAKRPAPVETVNDLDGEVVNFFRVIQNPESREKLQEWIIYTPYARQVYDEIIRNVPEDPVGRAACFAVKCMMSQGFRMNGDCGWKKDIYGREKAYVVKYWNELPESIACMATRLKQVQIENYPALELIKKYNHENVLMYLDPPYVTETRGGRKNYNHEMTDRDHMELLEAIVESRAKIIISGYDCELYDFYLGNWKKAKIAARTQDNRKRTETIWINYELEAEQIKLEI